MQGGGRGAVSRSPRPAHVTSHTDAAQVVMVVLHAAAHIGILVLKTPALGSILGPGASTRPCPCTCTTDIDVHIDTQA